MIKYQNILFLFSENKEKGKIPGWYLEAINGYILKTSNFYKSIIFMEQDLTIEIREDIIFFNEYKVQNKEDYFNVNLLFQLLPYEYYIELQQLLYYYNGCTYTFKI